MLSYTEFLKKLYCILIKEWEWEKQIEPYYQGNNFDLMVTSFKSEAPESPNWHFFPKKALYIITYVFLGFGCGECFTVAVRRGCSSLSCAETSHYNGRLLLQSTDSTLLLALQLQGLRVRLTGYLLRWHVGSFQTRGQTCVPCIAGWTLNCWNTWESPWTISTRITHLRLQFSKGTRY